MRAGLTGRVARVARVRTAVPEGCPACRGWPLVRYLVDGDPGPTTVCPRCRREWHGLTRMLVIERGESVDRRG